jgi:hypothetical protein
MHFGIRASSGRLADWRGSGVQIKKDRMLVTVPDNDAKTGAHEVVAITPAGPANGKCIQKDKHTVTLHTVP